MKSFITLQVLHLGFWQDSLVFLSLEAKFDKHVYVIDFLQNLRYINNKIPVSYNNPKRDMPETCLNRNVPTLFYFFKN